jgi:hypothetical protein
MTERVVVPFAGEGQGVGGLTWAQKGLWQAMQLTGSSLPLGGVSPMPHGVRIDDRGTAWRSTS